MLESSMSRYQIAEVSGRSQGSYLILYMILYMIDVL